MAASARWILTLVGALALVARGAAADAIADARKAVTAKDWPAAFEALVGVVEKTPDHREAGLALARVTSEGNLADAFLLAEETLLKVLDRAPADREARLALAEAYLAHGRRAGTGPGASALVAPLFADARAQFAKVLEADGKDEDAAVGIARVAYYLGDFDGAIAVVDALLAKRSTCPKASFWKGQALYIQATDAWGRDGPRADSTVSLFGRAAGAYEAAVTGDAASFDAWMQLAYSRQYLGETEAAQSAYEQAMDLDPESFLPLKGVEALFGADGTKYGAVLDALVKAHPKNAAVLWFRGHRLRLASDWADARRDLDEYRERSRQGSIAWYWIGKVHEGAGDLEKAAAAWKKALEFNPNDLDAAYDLEAPLRARGGEARGSASAALDLAKDYRPLLELAPQNPLIRNNLGFILRDALDAASTGEGEIRRVDGAWVRVLEECRRVYDEGAKIIGEFRREHALLPWERRYQYAGTINDAGLMYWYYPQVRDAKVAETYFQRAMDFTESGYRDACTNLIKMYLAQERWEDAWRAAADGVESLRDASGNEDGPGRALVRQYMDRMRSDGHAPAD